METPQITIKKINENLQKLLTVPTYIIGDYSYDTTGQWLTYKGGSTRRLTATEGQLLVVFTSKLNTYVSRKELINTIWNDKDYLNGRSLDIFMSRLRRLLSKDSAITLQTVHGKGFVMIVD